MLGRQGAPLRATDGSSEWAKRLGRVWPFLLIGAILALSFAVGWPVCPSRTLFGIPCPGCGMTRSVVALFTGDVASAMKFHPLGPVAVVAAAFAVLFHRRVPPKATASLALVGVAALVVVWLVRLNGGFGGLPDRVDPRAGLLGHLADVLTPSAPPSPPADARPDAPTLQR